MAYHRRLVEERPPARLQVLEWPAFAQHFRATHRQGEHVALVGPTGSGKSTLGIELCKLIGSREADDGRPARVVVFGTKPRDRTLSALHREGWPILRDWPPGYAQEHVIVWPRPRGDLETVAGRQSRAFRRVMLEIYDEGRQTVYIDEAAYFEEKPPNGLGLVGSVSQYWNSARALDLTLIAGTTRPRNVTRLMWSEPTWVMVFRIEDEDDLKRVCEMGDREQLEQIHSGLYGHEFLVVYRPRGGERSYFVSRVDRPRRRP